MTEREDKLNQIVAPIMEGYPENNPFLAKCVLNAADVTTSPARGCGGNCTDCKTISGITGQVDKICDVIEENGIKVYRDTDTSAFARTTGEPDSGAFY